ERDGDPGARAPAARQPEGAHGRAIGDQELAARDRLLEPREVLEAEAPAAHGLEVRLREAGAAHDAEGPRALVEAGSDRPGEIEDLGRAAHEHLPERVLVQAGAEPLREGEEHARDIGVLLLLLHAAHVDEREGRLPRDAPTWGRAAGWRSSASPSDASPRPCAAARRRPWRSASQRNISTRGTRTSATVVSHTARSSASSVCIALTCCATSRRTRTRAAARSLRLSSSPRWAASVRLRSSWSPRRPLRK